MSDFETRLQRHRDSLHGDFIPAVEALKFITDMRLHHGAELAAWLEANAVRFATDAFSKKLGRERRTMRARLYAEVVEAGGDLGVFQTVCEVDATHRRRPVGDMRAADHLYVADQYETSGKRDLLLAACHRAVARRIGRSRTSQVLTEAQYQDIFESILSRRQLPRAA